MIYERLKALYNAGVIKNLDPYVQKKLITNEQAEKIKRGD